MIANDHAGPKFDFRKLIMNTASWQRVDEPGTSYRYRLVPGPAFADGKQLLEPDGRPKVAWSFQPEEIPRIALYD